MNLNLSDLGADTTADDPIHLSINRRGSVLNGYGSHGALRMDAVPLASPSAVLPLPEITTPLSVGDWVEILTGSHRGCAGVVQSVEIGIDGEQSWVMVRLQGGPKVEVPRADVALIATDRN
jgi:hypothetical protein